MSKSFNFVTFTRWRTYCTFSGRSKTCVFFFLIQRMASVLCAFRFSFTFCFPADSFNWSRIFCFLIYFVKSLACNEKLFSGLFHFGISVGDFIESSARWTRQINGLTASWNREWSTLCVFYGDYTNWFRW